MNNNAHTLLIIAVISAVTALLRFLPFVLFQKKTPGAVRYLSTVLPYSVIGMLVVFCLKNVSVLSYPFGLPELISIAAVALLHVWKKNTLLSVGAGTILYMLLVQFVFT